mmetsp:Transcript_24639/g.48003  ORF Transcript_24639/g.48003 Transcript_24639/m.48003 type:complete len:289 (+) Transcript_24639:1141-2007(+)
MRHCATHEIIVLHEAIGQRCNANDIQLTCWISLARIKKVYPGISAHRPVVMLSRAIDASERLLMEENHQTKLGGLIIGHLHEKHIVVRREGGLAINRGHLMLCRSNLVVHDSHGTSELKHYCLYFVEQDVYSLRHGCKVVEVALLVARRQRTNQCAATVDQIRACTVEVCFDDKELLLPAEEGMDRLCVCGNIDCLEQPEPFSINSIIGTEQWRLVVNASTQVGYKRAWDTENFFIDKAGRRPIPCRESCGCMRSTKPSVGERGTISLPKEKAFWWQHSLKRFRRLFG